MRFPALAATAASLCVFGSVALADLIEKSSPHSVAVTIDRLQAAVEGAGATVFARVDHAEGAKSVDAELRPTEMLMFGNPALGTPAMQDAQTAGLDLPLRVLAFENAEGQVLVVYHSPETLAKAHALPADADYLKKMSGALNALTDRAIGTD